MAPTAAAAATTTRVRLTRKHDGRGGCCNQQCDGGEEIPGTFV